MSTVRKNVPGKINGFSQKSCVFFLAQVSIHGLFLSKSHEFRFDRPYFSLLTKTKLQLPQAPFVFGRVEASPESSLAHLRVQFPSRVPWFSVFIAEAPRAPHISETKLGLNVSLRSSVTGKGIVSTLWGSVVCEALVDL